MADIAGVLLCRGARLTVCAKDGYALSAARTKVGEVFLDEGFTAAGAVQLTVAEIAGNLVCSGAQLTGRPEDGYALSALGVNVGDNVLLDNGFTATGGIQLFSAHVGGSLQLMPRKLADNEDDTNQKHVSLQASQAQIKGALRWVPTEQVCGLVNLRGAAVGELVDDWTSDNGRENGYWPSGGRLSLDGFTFASLGGYERTSVDQRLQWIRSQYRRSKKGWRGYSTQPYEQLAAVYREAGQDAQARKVAIARRADLRKYGNLNRYSRFGNWFLDWTIRYGYRTWRAALGLAAVFVIFVLLSLLAQQHHLMMPVGDTDGLHFVPSATKCTSSYPCFYPIGYAVDTVIPIVNVHQADSVSHQPIQFSNDFFRVHRIASRIPHSYVKGAGFLPVHLHHRPEPFVKIAELADKITICTDHNRPGVDPCSAL